MWVSPRDAVGFFSLSIFCRLLGSWVLYFICWSFVFGFCADDARYDSWHDLVIPSRPTMLSCLVCTLSMTPSLLLTSCPASSLIATLNILILFFRRPFPQSQTHLHGIRPTHPLTTPYQSSSPYCSRTIALHVTYCPCTNKSPNNSIVHVLFRVLPRQSRYQSLLSTPSFTVLYSHATCILPSPLAPTTNRLDGPYPFLAIPPRPPIDHAIAVSLTLLLSGNPLFSHCSFGILAENTELYMAILSS